MSFQEELNADPDRVSGKAAASRRRIREKGSFPPADHRNY
jgi:hypothetical protein